LLLALLDSVVLSVVVLSVDDSTVAPITISCSEVMFSSVVVSSFPLTERDGTPTVSWVASLSPFINMAIDWPPNVADRNVHSSAIALVDSTVVHLIPSNTENLAVLSCRL